MLNKGLVFIGIALLAILIVENIVMRTSVFIFVSTWKSWTLVMVSAVIWIAIWYWLKWFSSDNKNNNNDDDDF